MARGRRRRAGEVGGRLIAIGARPAFPATLCASNKAGSRAMSQHDLKQLVSLLREELKRAQAGDPGALSHMGPLLSDLDQALAGPEEQDAGLRERLEAHIREFEVEHPRLTAILNDVMVSLGNLGI